MSSRQIDMCVGSVIGHNMTPDQRRADFQAEITRHVIVAKKIEAMSLEEIKVLSDKQRLTAYQNGHLIATIRACRMNPRLDAYFAVLAVVYAMADLSQRCCMLSATQIGQVLDRSERAVRAILSRLVDDGKIIKGEPLGRYGVVPHYPAIDRNTALATGSPDWIISAFVPGIFAKDRAGKTKHEQCVEDHPCATVQGSNTDPCSTRQGLAIDPCSTVHGVGSDPCTVAQPPMKCSAVTPDVQFIQNSSKEIALSKKIPPNPPMGGTDELSSAFLHPSFSEGVSIDSAGGVRLIGETRDYWLNLFAGDEVALDLATKEAAGGLQPHSKRPIKPQIERVLAKIVRESRDKDKRYEKAAEKNRAGARQQRKSASESIMEKVLPYTRMGRSQSGHSADKAGQSPRDPKLIDGICQDLD